MASEKKNRKQTKRAIEIIINMVSILKSKNEYVI